jgi:hypothetical protein
MEGGRTEVRSKLDKDAEDVSEREPLVRPISAPVPQVDDIDIAPQSFSCAALARFEPEHLGEGKGLDPSISDVPGDIRSPLELVRCI